MKALREYALIPEGYEINQTLTQRGWQMERLCVEICALWWGWSFPQLVHYYTYKCTPVWMATKKKEPPT
jgi:hypothetical protein